MNNKRGIAQAFSQPPQGVELRRATVFDVFGMSRVLIRSIKQLCGADHNGDAQTIANWTANKDAASIRDWVLSGAELWVADQSGQIAAVGGIRDAEITLLYLDPDFTGRGVGYALLQRLEQQIAKAGHTEAFLEATRTAQDFYLRNGWVPTGNCSQRDDLSCFAMRKSLRSSG